MKKGFILVLVLCCLVLCGCSKPYIVLNDKLSISIDTTTSSWINPSKILVDEVGSKILAIPVEIYNDREYDVVYEVEIRTPDYLAEGYEMLSERSNVWVAIPQGLVSVPTKSMKIVQVMVGKIEGARIWGNTEAWVSVKEAKREVYNLEFILRVLVKGKNS